MEYYPLIDYICEVFDIERDILLSKDRHKIYTLPRHWLIYFLKFNTDLTLLQIANIVGRKDHSTMLNAIKKMRYNINKYPEYKEFHALHKIEVKRILTQISDEEKNKNCERPGENN